MTQTTIEDEFFAEDGSDYLVVRVSSTTPQVLVQLESATRDNGEPDIWPLWLSNDEALKLGRFLVEKVAAESQRV